MVLQVDTDYPWAGRVKVAIQETGAAGDAMGPLSLTIQGARNGGTLRTAVRAAGRK